MKFIKFLFIILFLLGNCSTTSLTSSNGSDSSGGNGSLTLEEKDRLYPSYEIVIKDFHINRDVPADPPAPYKNKITIAEKKRIFNLLDDIKFVVNSKEFEECFLKNIQKPISFSCIFSIFNPPNKMEYEEAFNKNVMLNSIKNTKFDLTIEKKNLTPGGGNVASAAPATKRANINGCQGDYSLYSFLDTLASYQGAKATLTICDNVTWDNPTHRLTDTILQHEINHTLGYDHDKDRPIVPPNVVEASAYIDDIFNNIWYGSDFKNKYAKEIQAFRGYYAEKYKNLLMSDTEK